jgi:hypothetical protein
MSTEKKKAKRIDRRSLLRGAGLAAGAAAAASTVAVEGASAAIRNSKPQQGGYHVSDHIRAYYKTARF